MEILFKLREQFQDTFKDVRRRNEEKKDLEDKIFTKFGNHFTHLSKGIKSAGRRTSDLGQSLPSEPRVVKDGRELGFEMRYGLLNKLNKGIKAKKEEIKKKEEKLSG